MSNEKIGGVIVLFGGTGDLANKFLLPAFHQLYAQGRFSDSFALVGASRTVLSDDDYRDFARQSLEASNSIDNINEDFFNHIFYQAADNTTLEDFDQLSQAIQDAVSACGAEPSYAYYYSIAPGLYDETTTNLKASGILDFPGDHRVAVEKPFGEDFESAQVYYDLLRKAFNPEDIYLVDHFLGMETLQNIVTMRDDNPALEAIWNREYIDHIQISFPEDISIGSRGAFYDANGALLDMFQNHILQTVSMVTMDLPVDLTATAINDQKLALFKAMPSFTVEEVANQVVLGQYDDYQDAEDVAENSQTETYVAIQLGIDNDRWRGVPIYVRTGKSLAEDHSAVDVVLKSAGGQTGQQANRLNFALQPQLGFSMVVNQIHPTEDGQLLTTKLGPDENAMNSVYIPQPYENVLLDILKGSKRHIATYDEALEQWRITDAIRTGLKAVGLPDFPNYQTGDQGPKAAEELLAANDHQWIYRV